MKNTRLVSLFLAAAVLVACGGSATPAADAPVDSDPNAVSATAISEDSTAQEPTAAADAASDVSEPDVWTPDSYSNSLHLFDSYTVKFNYFVSANGQERQWTYTQSVQMEPDITVATWQGTESTGMGATTMITTEDRVYLLSGNPQTCTVLSNPEENPAVFNPETIMDSFVYDLVDAGAGPDVDGHKTQKYMYDNTLPDGSKYHSEVLVDSEELYTLKWDVSGETKNNDTREPFSWSYILSDINAVAPISMPDICSSATAATWPMPSDGQITLQTAQMFSLTSTQSLTDIATFYADAMPAAGYSIADGGMTTADTVLQVYTAGGKQVSVMMSAAGGMTTVIISQN